MVVLNTALLSLLIPAAVLARPNQHERLHKRHDHPYSPSNTAPYPTGNSTQTGPTGTGTAVTSYSTDRVTLTSIIEVVPVPVTETSSASQGHGGSPSSSPGSSGHPGTEDVCGPATVTVTSAKTVTVTVPVAGHKTPESKPAEHAAAPVHKPSPQQKPNEKAKEHPKPNEKPKEHPKTNDKPKEHPKPEVKPETKPEAKPEVKSEAKPAVHPQEAKPKEDTKPKHQPAAKAPETNQKSVEKPKNKSKTNPQTSSPSGGKKGILYKDLSQANAMSGHVSWGCNWDSSPIPAIGHAAGNLDFEFVPQLWGPDQIHTDLWAANSQGDHIKYVMAFNEPNQPRGAGGCGPISPSDAVVPYEKHMKDNKAHGQKIISPCVSNEAHEWLDTFIGATNLKPDVVCFHWYGEDLKGLQSVVSTFSDIQSKHGIPEIWMTEWALNVDIPTNDATKLLDWLENESGIQRYAYNDEKLANTPGVKAAYCGSH